MYEVYDYERIYIIEHQTKPLRRKTRPFDLAEQPYHQRLDHYGDYIPRKLRVHKIKGPKWRNTYWPK